MPNTIPTAVDVARIAALSDPVLRNLQITQCYHQLAQGMAGRTGLEANWCTFATWASKQAGQTIRKEDLGRTLEGFFGSSDLRQEFDRLLAVMRRFGVRLERQRLVRTMWQAVDLSGAFDRSSDAVGRGNLKVFAEIGHEFARFYTACLPDETFNQDNIERFLASLRPGLPPEGQDHLRQAFRCYYQALFEQDRKTRSELLLLANLLIGFHEQTRLQPEINEALEAPVISPQTFTQNLLRAYYPNAGRLANGLAFILHSAGRLIGFDGFVTRYLAGARRQAQFLVTELMMTIELPPNNRLRLGEDLPASYPAVLRQIENQDLRNLLSQIDPTPDSVVESGAMHWGDLQDRIHFIAELFRCFQTTEALFTPPFSPEQTIALDANQMPTGRL